MNAPVKKALLFAASLALVAVWVPKASAGCANPLNQAGHLSPQSWDGSAVSRSMLQVDFEQGPTMVGLWHVVFIAEGNNNPNLPPDGAQVDNALSNWHVDGTEETLSSRAPATGNVCLGVWTQTNQLHYKLNHFGIAYDPAVDPDTPLGFANIRQDILLSRDGKTFTGKFSIDQYDAAGNLLVEIKGKLVGTRITSSTTVGDLLS